MLRDILVLKIDQLAVKVNQGGLKGHILTCCRCLGTECVSLGTSSNMGSIVESDKRMESRLHMHMSGISVVRDTFVPKLDIQTVGLLLSQLWDISTCCTYLWIQ